MSREAALAIATGSPEAPKAVQANGADSSSTSTTIVETPISGTDDLVSSRIAKIAKKESEYREKQETHKKQLEEFHKQKSEFDPFYERYKKFEELKTKDPVEAIRLLGLTNTDFINFAVAEEDKSTPEERAQKAAQTEIEKFKKEQSEKESAASKQRNDETITQFKKNIGIAIKTDAEKFEFCNFYGESAEDFIFEIVNEAFQADVKSDPDNPDLQPMTATAAAELAENYYEEHYKSMSALKKATPKQILEEIREEQANPKKEEPLRAEVKPGMPARTLTNKANPTIAATAKKLETPSAKRERLIAALKAGVKP